MMRDTAGAYPFLLGTTSYIVPDDILPNVRMLCGMVDDVELVLFESPRQSNIPDAAQVRELRAVADDTGIGYTIHLPTASKAGSPRKTERRRFVDDARRVIGCCRPLRPRAWILHLEGIDDSADSATVREWERGCAESIGQLCGEVDDGREIAVENLGYPWYWHLDAVTRAGLSLCCDAGHLWLYSPDAWESHVAAMMLQTRVMHVHGVADGKDHTSLSSNENAELVRLLDLLKSSGFAGVLTLEVFNEKDLRESMEAIGRVWERLY